MDESQVRSEPFRMVELFEWCRIVSNCFEFQPHGGLREPGGAAAGAAEDPAAEEDDGGAARGVHQQPRRGRGLQRAAAARQVGLSCPRTGDEQVANRDIRVWHGATEKGP
jgi:hypothetical protein